MSMRIISLVCISARTGARSMSQSVSLSMSISLCPHLSVCHDTIWQVYAYVCVCCHVCLCVVTRLDRRVCVRLCVCLCLCLYRYVYVRLCVVSKSICVPTICPRGNEKERQCVYMYVYECMCMHIRMTWYILTWMSDETPVIESYHLYGCRLQIIHDKSKSVVPHIGMPYTSISNGTHIMILQKRVSLICAEWLICMTHSCVCYDWFTWMPWLKVMALMWKHYESASDHDRALLGYGDTLWGKCMGHVTHVMGRVLYMNESCHIYECVMPHTWMSHGTHMKRVADPQVILIDLCWKESGDSLQGWCMSHVTSGWIMSHIWMSRVLHHVAQVTLINLDEWVMSHMDESCHTFKRVMSHIMLHRCSWSTLVGVWRLVARDMVSNFPSNMPGFIGDSTCLWRTL